MHCYNEEHRHSALRFITPGQYYRSEDQALLEERINIYQADKDRNPNRCSGRTRNWLLVGNVALDPEKEITLNE